MARIPMNDLEKQHILKIRSDLLKYNAFLEITLNNLSKINCQQVGIYTT